mmetsp:Transcript_25728/g.63004  ORF Transcript_25728/g.63004 Transcript_25728/m.63004 type:complete len:551 (+) Transcript_25728:111-1763(+)|eukprot:CAMPEP_0113604050 /NCGR_PEP_ID=MMETSP0017_2-20120614/1595_1 /TAXON_ID=2856 /ORGANISM="Cylindrotheca closterium" /LENGTH=550 /DNA_ID=CAMNT_0000512463 /DNA_START=109 /DNA_END=1764 /DNA_ORIENTATION=+ /assembly_acc=CAM_ASM_000147
MAQSTDGNPSEAKAKATTSSKPISPARSPSKGGDFDVVKVSRIASIAIKNTGTGNGYSYRSSLGGGKKAFHEKKQSPKKLASKAKQAPEYKDDSDSSAFSKEKDEERTVSKTKQKRNGASSNEKTRSKQTTKSEQDKKSKSSSKRESSSRDNKPVRKREVRELQDREEEVDDSSDEDVIPGNDPMDVITISPYEGNANAEREVKLFEDLHSLLTEGSIKASKIFGEVNARIMVRAYNQIDQSGMVYSQEWVDGVMRGNNVGVLPKDLLLLCLVSNRLTKVDEFLMAGLTRDLELIKIIKEAVEFWDLEDDYKKIAGTAGTLKNFSFSSKRRHCFKCEIFVARAYSCYKAFGSRGRMDKSLMAKVRKCLEIMESRVPQPKGKDSRKRKKSLEKPAVVVTEPVAAEEPVKEEPPSKRKRGRPTRKTEVAPAFEESGDSGMDEDAEAPVVEDTPRPPVARSTPRSPVRSTPRPSVARSTSNSRRAKKELSVTDIISKFEEQYHEMGKMYEEMGKTLALLKSTAEENKSHKEESIRNEVRDEFMAEMQKRITKK